MKKKQKKDYILLIYSYITLVAIFRKIILLDKDIPSEELKIDQDRFAILEFRLEQSKL